MSVFGAELSTMQTIALWILVAATLISIIGIVLFFTAHKNQTDSVQKDVEAQLGVTVFSNVIAFDSNVVVPGTVLNDNTSLERAPSAQKFSVKLSNCAIFEVQSNTRGIIFPRMSQGDRESITAPEEGLIVYQTDNDSGFYSFSSNTWSRMISNIVTYQPTNYANSNSTIESHLKGIDEALGARAVDFLIDATTTISNGVVMVDASGEYVTQDLLTDVITSDTVFDSWSATGANVTAQLEAAAEIAANATNVYTYMGEIDLSTFVNNDSFPVSNSAGETWIATGVTGSLKLGAVNTQIVRNFSRIYSLVDSANIQDGNDWGVVNPYDEIPFHGHNAPDQNMDVTNSKVAVGSTYLEDNHRWWVCTDNSEGAASWTVISKYSVESSDPTINKDSGNGYPLGSKWINTSNGRVYHSVSASNHAATWYLDVFPSVTSADNGNVLTTSNAKLTFTTLSASNVSESHVAEYYSNGNASLQSHLDALSNAFNDVQRDQFSATTLPNANSDLANSNVILGSRWFYGTNVFVCVDNSNGAAVWNLDTLPNASVSNVGRVYKASAANVLSLDYIYASEVQMFDQNPNNYVAAASNLMSHIQGISNTLAVTSSYKLSQTSNPTSVNDGANGIYVGTRWFNVSSNTVFICIDNTVGEATWKMDSLPLLVSTDAGNVVFDNGTAYVVQALTDMDVDVPVGTNQWYSVSGNTVYDHLMAIDDVLAVSNVRTLAAANPSNTDTTTEVGAPWINYANASFMMANTSSNVWLLDSFPQPSAANAGNVLMSNGAGSQFGKIDAANITSNGISSVYANLLAINDRLLVAASHQGLQSNSVSVNPTTSDTGYFDGTIWRNYANSEMFVCTDNVSGQWMQASWTVSPGNALVSNLTSLSWEDSNVRASNVQVDYNSTYIGTVVGASVDSYLSGIDAMLSNVAEIKTVNYIPNANTDSSNVGAIVGSRYINLLSNVAFTCASNTNGAAVWLIDTFGTPVGGSVLRGNVSGDLVWNATNANDVTATASVSNISPASSNVASYLTAVSTAMSNAVRLRGMFDVGTSANKFPTSTAYGDYFIMSNASSSGNTLGTTNTISVKTGDVLIANVASASNTNGFNWIKIDTQIIPQGSGNTVSNGSAAAPSVYGSSSTTGFYWAPNLVGLSILGTSIVTFDTSNVNLQVPLVLNVNGSSSNPAISDTNGYGLFWGSNGALVISTGSSNAVQFSNTSLLFNARGAKFNGNGNADIMFSSGANVIFNNNNVCVQTPQGVGFQIRAGSTILPGNVTLPQAPTAVSNGNLLGPLSISNTDVISFVPRYSEFFAHVLASGTVDYVYWLANPYHLTFTTASSPNVGEVSIVRTATGKYQISANATTADSDTIARHFGSYTPELLSASTTGLYSYTNTVVGTSGHIDHEVHFRTLIGNTLTNTNFTAHVIFM